MVRTPNYDLDIDTTLGGANASDYIIPSQKAIKDYVDNHSGGGSVTVDGALSNTSENPVQNKVINAALDDKQDKFNAVSPLQMVRPGSVGTVYLQNTTTEFTGTTIDENLSVLKSGDIATGLIPDVDFTKSFTFTREKVVITGIPSVSSSIIRVVPGGSGGVAWIVLYPTGIMEAICNYGSYRTATIPFTSGVEYDFRITYSSSGTTEIQYKLSGTTVWTTALSYSYTLTSGTRAQYLCIDYNDVIVSNISGVSFVNNGVTKFERTVQPYELSVDLSNYPTNSDLSVGLSTKQDVLTWTYNSATENLEVN